MEDRFFTQVSAGIIPYQHFIVYISHTCMLLLLSPEGDAITLRSFIQLFVNYHHFSFHPLNNLAERHPDRISNLPQRLHVDAGRPVLNHRKMASGNPG